MTRKLEHLINNIYTDRLRILRKEEYILIFFNCGINICDNLCGLVVRVTGYRSRDPEFDSQRYKIFWEVVGLERGLSWV
jgi:hypothetical protein